MEELEIDYGMKYASYTMDLIKPDIFRSTNKDLEKRTFSEKDIRMIVQDEFESLIQIMSKKMEEIEGIDSVPKIREYKKGSPARTSAETAYFCG